MPNESLAAESYREGGEFSKNKNAEPENASTSALRGESLASNTTTTTSYGGTAPSYVENQYIQDRTGPHGKNISEGGADFEDSRAEDGIQKAMAAEPGSMMDPSRLAEQQFEQNQNAAGRDAGPKQYETTKETKYDALEETSA